MKLEIRPDNLPLRRKPRGRMSREEAKRLDEAAISSVLEGRAFNQRSMTRGKVKKTLEEEK